MNAVSKLLLFLGITGVSLYCCSKIFVDKKPRDAAKQGWSLADMINESETVDISLDSIKNSTAPAPDTPVDVSEREAFIVTTDFPAIEKPAETGAYPVLDLEEGALEPELDFTNNATVKALPAVQSEDDLQASGRNVAKITNPFFGETSTESTAGFDIPTTDHTGPVQHEAVVTSMLDSIRDEHFPAADNELDATPYSEDEFQIDDLQVTEVSAPVIPVETQVVAPPVPATVASIVQPAESTAMKAPAVVEQRAKEHIEYGKSLARRGAVFAAKQEFIQALRLIADWHDMKSGTRTYTSKLAMAMQALTESDDFVSVDSEQQLQMDVRAILESHTSKLIHPDDAAEMSPIHAMQTYYAFATDQMSQAVGKSPVASEALFSLGKMLTTAARFDISGKPMDRTKAMVMHHVALSADENNYMSSNELGVLMAGNGRWRQAAELFGESLKRRQTPTTWQNLARAHKEIARLTSNPRERAEQSELAGLALQESHMLGGAGPEMAMVLPTDWSSTAEFNASAAMPELTPNVKTGPPAEVTAEKPRTKLLDKVKNWF